MLRHYGLDFYVGKISCQLVSIQPENKTNRPQYNYYEHYHPCFELHYVEKGFCEYLCQKKTFRVLEGELLLIPPRIFHREIYSSKDVSKMSISIDILAPKENFSNNDLQFYRAFPREDMISLSVKDSVLQAELMQIRSLARNYENHYLNREKMRALCNVFLVDLFEKLINGKKMKIDMKEKPQISRDYVIDTFFALQFMSNSSNKDLAKELHVSSRQLHRMIKKDYNMNYRQKLKEIRIEIATNFLINTDKSISQIAELLGYSSSANFSTFVKNATGKTPTQIRQSKGTL